ncbi:MAG: hypothetical protein LAT64_14085 [Phycisphaerales bacterium]|nr:hypothetical protein [Planctomycetota bacterium]MCH8509880.1 hypothetical protein [Phycisphaerales bacterium]
MPDADPNQPLSLHCPRCRHDLAGLPGVGPEPDPGAVLICPECGTPTTVMAALDTPREARGWLYFMLWTLAALGALLFCGCGLTILGTVVWGIFGGGP